MAQLWVNLPRSDKDAEAGYQSITADIILTATEEGISSRVIAGEYQGIQDPTRTFTLINLWDTKLSGRTSTQ